MDFTSMYHEAVAIDRWEVLTEFCDLVGVNVQYFEIIDLLSDCHLKPSDGGVSNA
jgi:hypothetical protein